MALAFGLEASWSITLALPAWGKIASTCPDRSEAISWGCSSRGTNVTWSSRGWWPQYLVLRTRTSWLLLQDCIFQGPPENGIRLFISSLRSGLAGSALGNAAFFSTYPLVLAPPNRSYQSAKGSLNRILAVLGSVVSIEVILS